MKLQIKVAFKLYHQDQVAPAMQAEATATGNPGAPVDANRQHNCGFHVVVGAITRVVGEAIPDWVVPSAIRSTVRRHVEEFLKDTKYSILYDPESGVESSIKVL